MFEHPAIVVLAAAVLASCAGHPSPRTAPSAPLFVPPLASAPLPPPPPPSTPTDAGPPADGRSFAVVRAVLRLDECTGLGGEHYVFEIDEPGRTAKRNAHGFHLHLGLLPSFVNAFAPTPARYFVAELRSPIEATVSAGLRNARVCLGALPEFDARVSRLIEAPNLETARRMLPMIAQRGMPPLAVDLKPEGASDTIAVVRVQARERAIDRRFLLEAIDGSAPPYLDLPTNTSFEPWIGDILVIGSEMDGSRLVPTRILATDERSAAFRWAHEVRRNGWPAQAIPMDQGLATARWFMAGKVVEGRPGCRPSIGAPHGYGGNFRLPKMSAAAAPGLSPGDAVIAIVAPRFEDDACGNNLRVVRLYRTPKGHDLAMQGITESLIPLLD